MATKKIETRGRKSNVEKGLEPTVTTGLRCKRSIMDKAIELHGSLANAVLFASLNPPK
jgi:hypothetical protein